MLQPNSHLSLINEYRGGNKSVIKGYEKGIRDVVRTTDIVLSSNESPLGPGPEVLAEIRAGIESVWRYPAGEDELIEALAKKFSLGIDSLIIGNGSDELINLLAIAFLSPYRKLIHSEHGFLMYPISAQRVGASCKLIPEKGLKTDLDSILKAIDDQTKAIFIANPNNPTGSYLTEKELTSFLARVPKEVLIYIDTAYAEYVTSKDYSRGISWLKDYRNLTISGTFSKIYGLAGLRLGWMAGDPSIIGALNKLRPPFSVNSLAIRAGLTALEDDDHINKTRQQNAILRDWLRSELKKIGIESPPSQGNFVLAKIGGRSSEILTRLAEKGIYIRKMNTYGLSEYLRISIGTRTELEQLLSELGRLV